jgi:hypothetical protein
MTLYAEKLLPHNIEAEEEKIFPTEDAPDAKSEPIGFAHLFENA